MSSGYSGTLAKDLIRVEVGPVLYCLQVSRVREIVNPLDVVELPHERDFILGVADYRDEVVVVVDLRSFFALPRETPTRRTKWIIIECSGRLVGIVVDGVLDVFSSGDHDRRSVPVLDGQHRERGITTAYKHAGHLVFLLDADRLALPAMELDSGELVLPPSEAK